jgi:hypothetical protein
MISPEKNPYSFASLPIELFRAKVGALIENDLAMSADYAHAFTTNIADRVSVPVPDLQSINSELEFSEIRSRWNTVLREWRAAQMAEWVLPSIRGSLLDLLCGEGDVGERLSQHQVDVTLTERSNAYDYDRRNHRVPYYPFETLAQMEPQPTFDTVLLCAVLHHEPDPEALLSLGARMARQRLIIVENCLEPDFPLDYHLLVDIFFNNCLNKIAVDCPASHKTLEGWVALISKYGKVETVGRRDSTPGIPLSHHLLVVEL